MVKLKKIIECFINYKFYKHYFSGVSPLFELTPLIKEVKQVNTLIDIGSNKGQFSSILRNFFPDILIHSFEPQIDELKIQKRLLGKYNVNYYNFALGNEEKIMEFNITKRKDSSSLLNPIMQNSKIYSKERTINIFVKKLDNILSSDLLKGPILLKLDVQGFELQTLIGAKSFIKNVDYIISEVSYVDVYHNQVNSNKLIEFLNSNNFIIKKRCNLTILNGKKFQEDILFIKKY
jgi:FkbM family methyltransferase|tara:strand:- start:6771 stop:7472 length:702 start_codon:yes stop_codon:yes gene_type:complete